MGCRCLPVVGTPDLVSSAYACDDCGNSDFSFDNVDVDHGADDTGARPDSVDRASWLGEGWLWMPYGGTW